LKNEIVKDEQNSQLGGAFVLNGNGDDVDSFNERHLLKM
jgi:hypothetical protein